MTTYAEHADALTGGRWVPVKGILRWEPDPPAPDPQPDLLPIACPCGARMDEYCKDARGGNYYAGHAARLNDPPERRCPCGADLPPRRRMCDPCSVEARRESWRNYRRRTRSDEVAAQRERRAGRGDCERGERVAS